MPEDRPDLSGLLESPLADASRDGRPWLPIAVAAAVVAIVGGAVLIAIRSAGDGSADGQPSTPGGTPSTTIANTTTIAQPALLLEDPQVYEGVPGPDPQFDPTSSGFEMALSPIESLSLSEREFLGGLDHLEPTSLAAVGQVPGTQYRLFKAEGTNTFSYDPDVGQQGECYYLFGARELPTQISTDCHTVPTTPTIAPLWSGIESLGILAWAGLPPEASVAILVVDGERTLWQRPRSGVAAFSFATRTEDVELLVLDAAGAEIAHSDRTPLIEPPTGPIPGYGDFSGISSEDIAWDEAWVLVARCMTEHGYDTLGFPDGLFLLEVPGSESPVVAVAEACLEGMGLPPSVSRVDG